MAFDEGVAQRIREALGDRPDIVEKKMFGGVAFMHSGHMCCGVVEDVLMARVGPDAYADALSRPLDDRDRFRVLHTPRDVADARGHLSNQFSSFANLGNLVDLRDLLMEPAA